MEVLMSLQGSQMETDDPITSYMLQDIEFTVQENRLWMLQCRTGKRTGKGVVKIAVDMVNEKLIDTWSAIKMVEPGHLDQLLHPQFENPSAYKDKVIATGLPASPGAAVGQIVVTADDAEEWHAQGKAVILVMTNADTPGDALTARNNGAQGIGLCRTEHMNEVAGCVPLSVLSCLVGFSTRHESKDGLSLHFLSGQMQRCVPVVIVRKVDKQLELTLVHSVLDNFKAFVTNGGMKQILTLLVSHDLSTLTKVCSRHCPECVAYSSEEEGESRTSSPTIQNKHSNL